MIPGMSITAVAFIRTTVVKRIFSRAHDAKSSLL